MGVRKKSVKSADPAKASGRLFLMSLLERYVEAQEKNAEAAMRIAEAHERKTLHEEKMSGSIFSQIDQISSSIRKSMGGDNS